MFLHFQTIFSLFNETLQFLFLIVCAGGPQSIDFVSHFFRFSFNKSQEEGFLFNAMNLVSMIYVGNTSGNQ